MFHCEPRLLHKYEAVRARGPQRQPSHTHGGCPRQALQVRSFIAGYCFNYHFKSASFITKVDKQHCKNRQCTFIDALLYVVHFDLFFIQEENVELLIVFCLHAPPMCNPMTCSTTNCFEFCVSCEPVAN